MRPPRYHMVTKRPNYLHFFIRLHEFFERPFAATDRDEQIFVGIGKSQLSSPNEFVCLIQDAQSVHGSFRVIAMSIDQFRTLPFLAATFLPDDAVILVVGKTKETFEL